MHCYCYKNLQYNLLSKTYNKLFLLAFQLALATVIGTGSASTQIFWTTLLTLSILIVWTEILNGLNLFIQNIPIFYVLFFDQVFESNHKLCAIGL